MVISFRKERTAILARREDNRCNFLTDADLMEMPSPAVVLLLVGRDSSVSTCRSMGEIRELFFFLELRVLVLVLLRSSRAALAFTARAAMSEALSR